VRLDQEMVVLRCSSALPRLLAQTVRPGASATVRGIATALPSRSNRLLRGTPMVQSATCVSPRRGLSAVIDPLMALVPEPATAVALNDMLTVGPLVERTLAIVPPILLQFVFFSPLPAVKQFHDTGSTGDVSIMPYSMMVANGTLWFTYGAILSNPTIMLPNVTAIVMGTGYCYTFWRNRSP